MVDYLRLRSYELACDTNHKQTKMGPLRFSKRYGIATQVVVLIEIVIAVYINDRFVRPFVGDALAVILVYCFLKTWIAQKHLLIAGISLGVAVLIESLQATPFIDWIGLSSNTYARIILGSTFDWKDILAYIAGTLLIIIFDRNKTE